MGVNLNQSGSRSGRQSHRPMAEINVTPFVDVMMVLLVVFMVAAPLLSAGVPIDLPDSDAKALNNEDNKPLTVSLDDGGKIYIGETEVKQDRLVALLAAQTNNDPERLIYIKANRDLEYGDVMRVMGAINGAGFKKVALITNASTKAP